MQQPCLDSTLPRPIAFGVETTGVDSSRSRLVQGARHPGMGHRMAAIGHQTTADCTIVNPLAHQSSRMLPTVRGVIDRRILVNYRVEPAVLEEALPDPFTPQTVDGYAVGGICLIRLRDLRPRGVPSHLGLTTENAAHRIAVDIEGDVERTSGVYIPRRDTSSRLNTLLGGRVFPGVHHHASFEVSETDGRYSVAMESDDGETYVQVTGEPTTGLPADSVFESVEAASAFFEQGSMGYSPNERRDEYEGLELHTFEWDVTPLDVDAVASSYFEQFPHETVAFDHALLMRDIAHEWRSGESLCSSPAVS